MVEIVADELWGEIMRYHDVLPITRAEAQAAFQSNDAARVCDALVRVVFHDPDWKWVQETCLRFAKVDNPDVRGLAATCFGHLARIHGVLDAKIVVPVLREMLGDSAVAGRAEDALDDIRMFLKPGP